MLKLVKNVNLINSRTFKNFGHKREPIPLFTTIWHGFLTFTFIGFSIEFKRISKFFFGNADNETNEEIYNKGIPSSSN